MVSTEIQMVLWSLMATQYSYYDIWRRLSFPQKHSEVLIPFLERMEKHIQLYWKPLKPINPPTPQKRWEY